MTGPYVMQAERGSYLIYDKRRGHREIIARIHDAVIAQKIVDALNILNRDTVLSE